ncbi:MAG: GntR family transcriptional regulator [Candidatus Dormibacteria bacterium]
MSQEAVPALAASIAVVAASVVARGRARSVARTKILTKAEAAYVEIRERILLGTLIPGSIVNQGALAYELGISITPLREALRRLEGEGLIEVGSDKSPVVVPLNPRELSELHLVRRQLDPLAASLAADLASAEDGRNLVSLADRLAITVVEERHAAHRDFPKKVYEIAENEVLRDALAQLWLRLDRYRVVTLSAPVIGDAEGVTHDVIAMAIQDGNAEVAARLMRDHLDAEAQVDEETLGPLWQPERPEAV